MSAYSNIFKNLFLYFLLQGQPIKCKQAENEMSEMFWVAFGSNHDGMVNFHLLPIAFPNSTLNHHKTTIIKTGVIGWYPI